MARGYRSARADRAGDRRPTAARRYDPRMPHAMTVRGPIDASELGFTLPHEHTQIRLWQIPDRWDYWELTRDEPVILDELRALTGWSRRRRVESGGPIDSRPCVALHLIYEIDPRREIAGGVREARRSVVKCS